MDDPEIPIDVAELLSKVNQGLHACMRCGADAPVVQVSRMSTDFEGMIAVVHQCGKCGWTGQDTSGIGPLVPRPAICVHCGGPCSRIPAGETPPAPEREGEPAPRLRCERCAAPGTREMELLPFKPVPPPDEAVDRMREWASTGDVHRALACANYILIHDFQNRIAWEAKAAILAQVGFTQSLLRMLEEALARGGPVALNRLYGHQLYAAARYEEAISAYQAYVATEDPFGLPDVFLAMANALRLKGDSSPEDKEAAKRTYQQAISLSPDNLHYRRAYSSFLSFEGRFSAALPHLERALQLADSPEVELSILLEYGQIRRELEDWEGVIRDCDRALEIRPDFVETLYLRAFALGRLGRFGEVRDHVGRILTLSPGHPGAMQMKMALAQVFPDLH